jgi:4-hydroxy-tetrahydrodipicolinate synthase
MIEALERVSGVPITPFHDDGSIDEPATSAVVDRMARQGVPIIVPCGGTGEFSALTATERDRVVRLTIEAARDAYVIAGVGGDAQSAAAATRAALAAGAHGVMVHALTDPYLTAGGTVQYFERIAAACDGGAVVPYLKGRLPDASALERILALEGVVAVKWAVPDLQGFASFVERFGGDVVPICGLAELWAPFFMLAGGRGFTSGLVNVDARLSLGLHSLLADGDWAGAMELWRSIKPFEELRARHDAGNNVPAVKEAAVLAGLIPSATVRPPLAPLSAVDRADLERVVAALLAAVR